MGLRDRVNKIARQTAIETIKPYLLSNTSVNPLNNPPMVPVVDVDSSNNVVVQMPDGSLQTVVPMGMRVLGVGDMVLVDNGVAL